MYRARSKCRRIFVRRHDACLLSVILTKVSAILGRGFYASQWSILNLQSHHDDPSLGRVEPLLKREIIMKTHYTVAFAMLAGFGLGAIAVQGLHAQANPPAYSVAEIDITDQAAYSAYVPKAQAAIKAAGGKILAAGGKITSVEGDPPKSRVVIQQWDSLEKYQAYRNSAAFKELLPTREKVAKWRTFVVEAVPQ